MIINLLHVLHLSLVVNTPEDSQNVPWKLLGLSIRPFPGLLLLSVGIPPIGPVASGVFHVNHQFLGLPAVSVQRCFLAYLLVAYPWLMDDFVDMSLFVLLMLIIVNERCNVCASKLYALGCPPQDAGWWQMKVCLLGTGKLTNIIIHVLLVVTSQHPGQRGQPKYMLVLLQLKMISRLHPAKAFFGFSSDLWPRSLRVLFASTLLTAWNI